MNSAALNSPAMNTRGVLTIPATATRAAPFGHPVPVAAGPGARLIHAAHLGRRALGVEGLVVVLFLGLAQGAVQTYRYWRDSFG